MEEDDPDAFDLLVQFIYTKQIVLPQEDPPNLSDNITRYLALVRLADKIGLLDLGKLACSGIKNTISDKRHDILERSHLDTVFAEDWPAASELGTSLRNLFAYDVMWKFKEVARSDQFLTSSFKSDLAEVPGLAFEVLNCLSVNI